MAIGPITLDCACLGPHAGTIDRIARLELNARRKGSRIQLSNVDDALLELMQLCGLAATLGVEPRRKTEQREKARGVKKKGEVRNPAV
jgi:hypothetical protein